MKHFLQWSLSAGVGAIVLSLCACNPTVSLQSGSWGDPHAPVLLEQRSTKSGHIELEFDEDVHLDPGSLRSNADHPPASTPPTNPPEQRRRTIAADTSKGSKPGRPYTMAAAARDKNGNVTQVLVPYYGANPQLPKVLINELATRTATTVRDTVELRVLEDGNLAGLTLHIGTPTDSDAAFTFAALDVKAGDYLLIHCKPDATAAEIDEYGDDVRVAAGKGSSASARDFWLPNGPGLPDSSGVVTLCESPIGSVMDAVFYSDKTTTAGKDYDSFGTKRLQERVQWLVKQRAWQCAGTRPTVEDGARMERSTATRTLCRGGDASDTNQSADWHVVPSGRSTLGSINSDEVQP